MALVWNPTREIVSTKIAGSWFTFKPDTRKAMDEDKCRFISENRKDTGLVILPDQFDPLSEHHIPGFDDTAEGRAVLEQKAAEGIEGLLSFHKDIIRNNQVALRKDLATKYPNGDHGRMVALEMSSGEIHSLEMVAKYQKAKEDNKDAKLKEVQKLLDAVGPMAE